MEKQLFDTSLPENYSRALYEEHNYELPYNYIKAIADVSFSAIAMILNDTKSKDHPTAFRVEKTNGTFVAAAICQYFENDDKKNPGNWSLTFTFDEKDIPEDATSFNLADPQVHSYFRSIAGDKYYFTFLNADTMVALPSCFFAHLYKWLDENASATEEVSVSLEGVFQARVAIEGNEKVFAIEPDGEIKVLIKDDASIQK